MNLGVIIVTYNSSRVLADCLSAVDALLPEADICVVDNDSSDSTVETARRACARAIVVSSGGNLGYAAACNLGFSVLRQLGPDIVLVVNPDVVLQEGSSSAVEHAFLDSAVTHCGAAFGDTARPCLASARSNWMEMMHHSLVLVIPRRLYRPYLWLSTRCPRGAYASGGLMAVRSDAWQRAGGFDEDYFLYYEDRDFSERLQDYGPVVSLPELRGVHPQGTGSGEVPLAFRLRAATSGWLLYISKDSGVLDARRWCLRTMRLQRALAALLGPVAHLGIKKARFKRQALLELAGFLSAGLQGLLPLVDDPPSLRLSWALWGKQQDG